MSPQRAATEFYYHIFELILNGLHMSKMITEFLLASSKNSEFAPPRVPKKEGFLYIYIVCTINVWESPLHLSKSQGN